MTNLEHYVTDGMPWQVQMALAYVQGHCTYAVDESWNAKYHDYDAKTYVTHYDRGREKGYVISVRFNYEQQKNYAIYEHCVSDEICLVMSDEYTDHPNGWEGREWSKYDQDKTFDCDDAVGCGKYIVEDIRKQVTKWIKEDKEFREKAEKKELIDKVADAIKTDRGLELGKTMMLAYYGAKREEAILEVYLNDDGEVVVVSCPKGGSQDENDHSLMSEFALDEIREMVKLLGIG